MAKKETLTHRMKAAQLAEVQASPAVVWGTDAAAAFLGVSVSTLRKWRQDGDGPPYVQVSANRIGYRRVDMEAWIDTHTRHSTSSVTPPPAPEGGGS